MVVRSSFPRPQARSTALVAAIAGVAALLGFLIVLSLVLTHETVETDGDFLLALHAFLTRMGVLGVTVAVFLVIATLSGGWGVTVLVTAVVGLCAARRRFGLGAMSAASAIGGSLLTDAIKQLTARPRPALLPHLATAQIGRAHV